MKLSGNQLVDAKPGQHVYGMVATIENATDIVLRRLQYLNPDDRMMMTCVLKTGCSYRHVGRLMGKPAATVNRRIKRLQKVLTEPHIAQLLDSPGGLEPADREIAIGYFVRGQTLRHLAKTHGVTEHQVGRRVEYFKGWMRGQIKG